MTDIWIAPDHLFDGQSVLSDHAVRIQNGRITDLAKTPKGARRISGTLSPGFVDLQVNGGGGVMFNGTPTPDGLAHIAQAHRKFGTVAIMPTVITDHADVLDQAAEAAIAAAGQNGIIGLHIEGPHISNAKRGTHDPSHIRPLDTPTMDIVARLRQHELAVMITLAPEAAMMDQIGALAALGAIVSLGHTDADADTIEGAITAGATCATHLFNAMSPMTARAPGAVGAILNSTIPSGIICDGHHVDDRMIKLALQARPKGDLMFLVSDAMATVGGPDAFTLYGQTIRLADGRLINADGNLAGAHITQAQGVARLVQQVGVRLEQALRMAVTIPSQVVGQPDLAQLVGRSVQDVIVLSDNLTFESTLDDIANPTV